MVVDENYTLLKGKDWQLEESLLTVEDRDNRNEDKLPKYMRRERDLILDKPISKQADWAAA